jgi:hypothetical protein
VTNDPAGCFTNPSTCKRVKGAQVVWLKDHVLKDVQPVTDGRPTLRRCLLPSWSFLLSLPLFALTPPVDPAHSTPHRRL